MGLDGQVVDVTGFGLGGWGWANERTPTGDPATLAITTTGLYTINLWLREDGLRIDRLLLTTDTGYIPTGFGPAETPRLVDDLIIPTPLTRTIVYTYDHLYHLTHADYTTGESYQYSYDPVGNRLQQIINGDTTDYLYDAANRLEKLNGQPVYTFDANGNLLNSDVLTNTFDAANRLIQTQREGPTLQPIYNGVGDRVGQTVGVTTTYFALDIAGGLPEVIYTSEGNAYLHLPGVIVAESSTGETRYLLSDGLGSIRQAMDENGAVVAYSEFDPWGNPVASDSEPYGFTGEWWEDEVRLLHLRARWYVPYLNHFILPDTPATAYLVMEPVVASGADGVEPLGGEPAKASTPSLACLSRLLKPRMSCPPDHEDQDYQLIKTSDPNLAQIDPQVISKEPQILRITQIRSSYSSFKTPICLDEARTLVLYFLGKT